MLLQDDRSEFFDEAFIAAHKQVMIPAVSLLMGSNSVVLLPAWIVPQPLDRRDPGLDFTGRWNLPARRCAASRNGKEKSCFA